MRTSKGKVPSEDSGLVSKIFRPLTYLLSIVIRWLKNLFYDVTAWVHLKLQRPGKEKKLGSMATKRRKELIFFICLIAYPMLQFLVFYVGTNINSILLAFQEFDVDTGLFHFLSGERLFLNFKDFLEDMAQDVTMVSATKNSIKLYAMGLLIGFPLNLIFSFFLYKKVPGSGFYRVILFLPSIISSLVISLMFRYFVENALSELIGFNLLTNKSTGFGTMIFYCIWAGFGSAILIYTSAMTKIDESIVEYGELEGISLLQEFWYVTLPLIYPTITIFLVSGIAALFTNQASLFNFYGTGARADMQTLGYIFFVRIMKSETSSYRQYPYASAAGLLFTLVATPITLFVKWALEKYGPSVE